MRRDICRLGSPGSILQATEIGLDFIEVGLELHLVGERNVRFCILLEARISGTIDHHSEIGVCLQIRRRGCAQRNPEFHAIPCLFSD